MKFFLTLIAMVLLVTPAIADHHEGGDAPAMPPMGKPAEMDALAFMHGEWNVEMSYKMDPMGEWLSAKGSAVCEPILNGCANRLTYTGEIMGMPFHGYDTTTYNREFGRYESIWVDDMQARFTVMHGGFKDGMYVMEGTDQNQGMEYLSRMVTEKKSDDEVHWVMTMSMDGGETWMDGMKMVYSRK